MEPENERFVALMKTAEWSSAETARRLHMSRGGVSQIINGHVRPSPQTLALLIRVVAEHKPDALTPSRYPTSEERVEGSDLPAVRAAADQLRELHATDPAAFTAAANVIETIYRKTPAASSKTKAVAKALAETAASKVRAASPAPARKPKADDANAKK